MPLEIKNTTARLVGFCVHTGTGIDGKPGSKRYAIIPGQTVVVEDPQHAREIQSKKLYKALVATQNDGKGGLLVKEVVEEAPEKQSKKKAVDKAADGDL